jgi:DNA (cytosine-5)-methyltransferase 1
MLAVGDTCLIALLPTYWTYQVLDPHESFCYHRFRPTMMKSGSRKQTHETLVSLFSGAMGLDLGLESARFKLRAAVENNEAARKTILLNRPKLSVLHDVTTITTRQLLNAANLRKGELTVLSGGPCCQSFSTAGKRHSLRDPRGNLFQDFCRIVKEARPRFFVMENVPGILSAAIKHRPLNRRGPGFPPLEPEELYGSAFSRLIEELKRLDYYVIFGLMNAADYGVPQKRRRVVFVGSRDGEPIYLPQPTHRDPSSGNHAGLSNWVTLRSALANVCSEHWYEFSQDRKKYLSKLKAGQNWRHLPPALQKEALGAAYVSWGGRSGFCRRLSWDEPAPTLTTAPDGRATTLCHPTQLRPLSVEEYAAIQQFPGNWEFAGSIRQQYELIGNAVPLGLGRSIGYMLRSVMAQSQKLQNDRQGQVVCADELLSGRLRNRRLTRLNPSRMRRYKNAKAAHKWLTASLAGQRELEFSECRK